MGSHSASCASQKLANSAPVLPAGSSPTCTSLARVAGLRTAAIAAASSLATAAAGVFWVAKMPCQLVVS